MISLPIVLKSIFFDVCEPVIVLVQADPGTNQVRANEPRHTTHDVHDSSAAMVDETEIGQPTVSPAPS